MNAAVYIVTGIGSGVVSILAGFLIGHRAGVLRERDRSWRRTGALIELRRAVERKAAR